MFITILLVLALGIDWASGYAIAGYVMHNGVLPNGYAFWQSFGPLTCMVIIQIMRSDLKPVAGGIKYAIGSGLFGIAIPNLLIYYAARKLDSGILTVLANLAPIFTYPLALIFNQEQFNKQRLLLVLIGIVGIMILIIPHSQITTISKLCHISFMHGISPTNFWLYVSLLIPLCYAFAVVYISRYKPYGGNILNYSLWMLVVSTIVITPLTLSSGEFYMLGLNYNSFLILLEILLSTAGYILLFMIIHRVGPVFFILVNAVASVCGLLYGGLLFGQHIGLLSFAGAVLIIIAIVGMSFSYVHK